MAISKITGQEQILDPETGREVFFLKKDRGVERVGFDAGGISTASRSFSAENPEDVFDFLSGRFESLTKKGFQNISQGEFEARQSLEKQGDILAREFTGEELSAFDERVKQEITKLGFDASGVVKTAAPQPGRLRGEFEENKAASEDRFAEAFPDAAGKDSGAIDGGTRFFKNPTTGELKQVDANVDVATLNNQGFSEISQDQFAKDGGGAVAAGADVPVASPDEQVELLIKQADQEGAEGISNLLQSGKIFNEIDAKNFAFFKGDKNFQRYIGGVAGQPNPLYIGSTAFGELQRKYTSHQIEQATIRTKDGIYWRPDANIADIPTKDPNDAINNDTIVISDLISNAKDQADPFLSDKVKDSKDQEAEDKASLDIGDIENKKITITDLTDNNNFSFTQAEDLYNELFKTDEIKNAQSSVTFLQSELDEFDQQLEELKSDIRKEVEGEASESAITALATIRGEQILKQKRSKQRDFDTALSQLNNLKDSAQNVLNLRIQDKNERFDRMVQTLNLQFKQEGFDLDQETQRLNNNIAILNTAMSIPQGKSIKFPDGSVIEGLDDTSDINVVDFTNANNEVFRMGIDSKTGEIKFNTFIGKGQPKFKPTTSVGDTTFKFNTTRVNDGVAVGFTTQDLANIQTSINNGNSVNDIIAANPELTDDQKKFLQGQSLSKISEPGQEEFDASALSDDFITNAINTATTQIGDDAGNIIGEEIDVNKLPGKTPAEKDALLQEAFKRNIRSAGDIDTEDEESSSFFDKVKEFFQG